MQKYIKQATKYFSKYPTFNSMTHGLGGIGVGFLLTYPLAGAHPVRWGVAFLIFSALAHVWAATHR